MSGSDSTGIFPGNVFSPRQPRCSDERGKGLIVRGGRARIDKGDRHPYLDRADAYDLVRRSLKAYFSHHSHHPARIVVFKTSRFEGSEIDGIGEALDEAGVAHRDLVWVSENSPIALHRVGSYPPLRGTLIGLGDNAVLYTRGSVPYYRTYPGLRVPIPLMLRPHQHDTPLTDIARDGSCPQQDELEFHAVRWGSAHPDQSCTAGRKGAQARSNRTA